MRAMSFYKLFRAVLSIIVTGMSMAGVQLPSTQEELTSLINSGLSTIRGLLPFGQGDNTDDEEY
ncbi:MAG: hypothetical protein IJ766_01790 [Clostridia bacterium]|nr:hypothetical protein [Clostridia bacterium]